MKILFIDDNQQDIEGLMQQCIARSWGVTVARSFGDAAEKLADKSEAYDAVVIDIMLPWGDQAPADVELRYSDQFAGLYLLEAMRRTPLGAAISTFFKMESIGRHTQTNAIVLSIIPSVQDRCDELGVTAFFNKMDYSFRDVTAALDNLEEQTEIVSTSKVT